MKREFEHINYSEKERRAMLENSGVELERMLSRETSRQPAPGHAAPGHMASGHAASGHAAPRHSGAERGTGRHPRERRGTEGADAKNAGPGYGGPGDRAPVRPGSGQRGQGAASSGQGPRYAGADSGYGPAETGYRAPDAQRHRLDAGRQDTYHARHGWEPDYDDADEYGDDADDDDYADDGYDSEADDDADDDYGEDYRGAADGGYSGRAESGYRGARTAYRETGGGYRGAAVFHVSGPPGYGAGLAEAEADGYGADTGFEEPDDRTEVLINHGRRHARPKGIRRLLRHWRAIGAAIAGVTIGAFALALILPGNDATWPASVAVVQKEIAVACENPNVVSEPSQVNFACAKDTQQILWVFSLLTSGDNPNYSDAANGRKGLEPITPAQGGDVAWSLNLHHPYDPANPVDSLEVAARAINNIIGGATLTGSNGAAVVQQGLESTAANCARYTGSSSLVTRQGFPAVCAQPVASPGGQAALVSDVFQQWMVGTPAQIAQEAGVLFENADNPGDSRVQAIVNSLPQTGL